MLLQLMAIAWLLGSGLAAIGHGFPLALAAAALALGWARRRPWPERLCVAVLLAAVSAGAALRYAHTLPAAAGTDVSHFIGDGPTRVRGVVDGDRDEREHALMLRLAVTSVEDDRGWHAATGLVLLRLPLSDPYDDSDRIEVAGKPKQPTQAQGFDYRAYLAQQGVFAEIDYPSTRLLGQDSGLSLQHWLIQRREQLDAGIRSALPEPEGTLGAGLAFGTRRITDPSLSAALQATDAAMIAVATGYNVTVVGMFVLSAFAWLVGRRQAAVLGLIVLWGYALLIGFYPSVLRAAVMGSVVLAAVVAGRPNRSSRSLLIACAGMVAIDPQALLSYSFPLSFAATAGVIWWQPATRRGIERGLGMTPERADAHSMLSAAIESAATTLAAMAAALPVVVAATHTLSLSALPANLLLFPLLPALMAGSAVAAVAGAFGHALAVLVAPLAYVLLLIMVWVVRICASLPASQIPMPWFGPAQALGVSALLFLLTQSAPMLGSIWHSARPAALRARLTGLRSRLGVSLRGLFDEQPKQSEDLSRFGWPPASVALAGAAAISLVVVALAAAALVTAASGPSVRVTYLDVGTGSAILVQSGADRILIDGGPPGDATVQALDRVLPPWQRSLSAVVISERSAGHVGGLPAVLERYRIGAVLDATSPPGQAAAPAGDATWKAWQQALAGSRVMTIPPVPHTVLALAGASMSVDLAPSDPRSPVAPAATVVVDLGSRRMLLAGDATASLAADVRSVNRGNASLPPSQPRLVVLESEQSVAGRVADPIPAGLGPALIYRTAESGDVRLDVTQRGLQIRVGRGPRLGLEPSK